LSLDHDKMEGYIEAYAQGADEVQIAELMEDWSIEYDYDFWDIRVEQEGSDVFIYCEVDLGYNSESEFLGHWNAFVDYVQAKSFASRINTTSIEVA